MRDDEGAVRRLLTFYDYAQPQELEAARYFYYEAHRFALWLAAVSNLSVEVTAAIIAALSLRTTWEANQVDAVCIALGADVTSLLGAGDGDEIIDVEVAPARYEATPTLPGIDLPPQPVETRGRDPRNGFRGGGGAGWQAMPRDVYRALAMANGARVEDVLLGPKVNAFMLNILKPDRDVGLPIDRHLGRALWGRRLDDAEISRRIASTGAYSDAERIYGLAAAAIGVRPIEFGNTIWYVIRRLSRESGQLSLAVDKPWRPIYPGGRFRLSTKMPRLNLLPGCDWRPWLWEEPTGPCFGNETRSSGRGRVRVTLGSHERANSSGWQWRYLLERWYSKGSQHRQVKGSITVDPSSGRARIYNGVGEPWMNSGGWQYLSRYLVMESLGERLREDEHVDHIDGDKTNNDPSNLRVVLASEHGRWHANGGPFTVLAEWNPNEGCFERSKLSAVDDGSLTKQAVNTVPF